MMGQWLCGYGNVSGLFIINAKNFEFRAKIILLDFVFLGQAQFPELNHLLTGPAFRSTNRHAVAVSNIGLGLVLLLGPTF